MKIFIQGQDYTGSLDTADPLMIERKLNQPSTCRLCLVLPTNGCVAKPLRSQAVLVIGDDGTTYFSGYIASATLPGYIGMGTEGPRYRLAVDCISDELLADQLQMLPARGLAGQGAGALIASLLRRTGCSSLSTQALTLDVPVSQVTLEAGAAWSRWAGQVASAARAGYRVVSGSLQLAQIPVALHSLQEADGSLNLASLAFTSNVKRPLANDVTVCGEREPAAYVTEYFLGDGTTTQFDLSELPFFPSSSRSTIIEERFSRDNLDLSVWSDAGAPGHFYLGAGGLKMNGGNGLDGDTLLTWIDPIEMAGTLLLEARGLSLSAGSAGVLTGFFSGLLNLAGCIAGFQIRQQSGQTVLQPVVLGSPAGLTYVIDPANQYTLRVRCNSKEDQRTHAVFRSFGDNGAITYGGQNIPASGRIYMDIQEFVDGVAGMPVMLYDGSISSLPESCWVVAASSLNLVGTMRALDLSSLGSGWVATKLANGTISTRRLGSPAECGECSLDRSGKLTFNSGFVPGEGEEILVSYRSVGRAIGRAIDGSNQSALSASGLPSQVTWIGSVLNPPVRSSTDCRNAAFTLVSAASAANSMWSGTYKAPNVCFETDVWPGDALAVNSPSLELYGNLVIRSVTLTYRGCYPDLVNYEIAFANDWADDLAIKTSSTVPSDAWLPAPISPNVLPNLSDLAVTALNGTSVSLNTGTAAPAGGGFEIRRRDFAFMPGEDSDLVLRGSQMNLTFSRESANDRFYIRMYDGENPRNYSEFSTALFINLPLGS